MTPTLVTGELLFAWKEKVSSGRKLTVAVAAVREANVSMRSDCQSQESAQRRRRRRRNKDKKVTGGDGEEKQR